MGTGSIGLNVVLSASSSSSSSFKSSVNIVPSITLSNTSNLSSSINYLNYQSTTQTRDCGIDFIPPKGGASTLNDCGTILIRGGNIALGNTADAGSTGITPITAYGNLNFYSGFYINQLP